MSLLGATVSINDHLTFYGEYVDWDVQADGARYAAAKDPWFDEEYRLADRWADATGWTT
mgnify:CR=1 FL=1